MILTGNNEKINTKMLSIPFYLNHSHKCAQTAMKSVLKVVLPERDFSYKELDELVDYCEGKIVFPCQIAAGFLEIGIDFDYYVRNGGLNQIIDENIKEYIQKFYGKNCHELLGTFDIDTLKDSARKVLDSGKFVELTKRPSVEYLVKLLESKSIPICLINYDTFVGRENKFKGHYLIITGFDNDEIIYHDTGPKGAGANKRVSESHFEQAWNLCPFDWGLIAVKSS
jgi:hypothetical protein